MQKSLQYFVGLTVVVFCCFSANAQDQAISKFDSDFATIDNELRNWDPVRGKWLSASLKNMANDEPIPDRTFPEDLSPGEMIEALPASTANSISAFTRQKTAESQRATEGTSRMENPRSVHEDQARWSRMNDYLSRRGCKPVLGRSYGDPHLKSFDGEQYSFQTVGEFVMASNANGGFEIQVRQQASGEDFSLNTAAAMNVGGDRVAIYANGTPDGFNQTPLRVNGMPVEMSTRTYFLPRGGTIKMSRNNYLVVWPTGETASFDMRRSGRMGFMNIGVQVYPCARGGYQGLLGNANGSRYDDFNTTASRVGSEVFGDIGMSDDMKRSRRAYLAREFADAWRIEQFNSLFDYGMGMSTLTYTDRSFPRTHRTINDLPRDRREAARRTCAARGLTGRALEACMFDNGFLRLEPTPVPQSRPHPRDVAFTPVTREEPNVNPPRVKPIAPKPINDVKPAVGTKPVEKKDVKLAPAPSNPNTGTVTNTKKWEPAATETSAPSSTPLPRGTQPNTTKETPSKPAATPQPPRTSTPSKPRTASPAPRTSSPPPRTAPAPRPRTTAPPVQRKATPKPKPRVSTPRTTPPPRSTPKPAPKPRPATPRPASGGMKRGG